MSDEVFTGCCTRCGKRRRLRLAHTEPNGGEWWLCRGCKAEHDKAVTGTRGIASRFTATTEPQAPVNGEIESKR